jgi:soluble cytochrome b562
MKKKKKKNGMKEGYKASTERISDFRISYHEKWRKKKEGV